MGRVGEMTPITVGTSFRISYYNHRNNWTFRRRAGARYYFGKWQRIGFGISQADEICRLLEIARLK